MGSLETRRYRILGVLGEGGHGKVYRARLEAGSGFTKDVAIKMLHDSEPAEELLRRFRDEARILGLLRDRAIVGVDPPTQLGGRWAVVMEFVDGLSGQQLVDRGGPLPIAPALGIIAEAARVLDKTWTHPGPDGEPLRLLHRDIKPANLQVTSSGEVKLLDFGIARADFHEREAATTRHVMGTPGYIAPERIFGADTPAGDVYSLGTTLHVFLFGAIPEKTPAPTDATGVLAEVIALIERTRIVVHDERPTAREVERACTELMQRAPKPSLRDWAEFTVPASADLGDDERSGDVLTEAFTGGSTLQNSALGTGRAQLAAGTLGLGLTLIVASALVFGGAFDPAEPPPPSAAPAVTPASEEAPVVEPPEEPAPTELPAVDEPAPAPTPAERAVPSGPPAPHNVTSPPSDPESNGEPEEPPEPAPEPVGPTWPITIASVPVGARVTVDGVAIGNTPIIRGAVPLGSHELTLTLGDATHSATIVAGRNHPQRYVWRVADDGWQAEY